MTSGRQDDLSSSGLDLAYRVLLYLKICPRKKGRLTSRMILRRLGREERTQLAAAPRSVRQLN